MTSPSVIGTSAAQASPIRVTSAGHAAFALALIALGIIGLVRRDLPAVWQPVPKWVPGHAVLAYAWAAIGVGSGIGLLWERTARAASGVLLVCSSIWLLVLRLPNLFYEHPLVLVAWTFGKTAIMVAAAWVLYIQFAGDGGRSRGAFATDGRGLRSARALYGLSLIPFGLAHFMYLNATTVLIPSWLPWHVALAYLTGAAFIAAGLAVCVGILGHVAAALSALQLGLFGLIVWVPRVLAGKVNDLQRGEFIVTFAAMAGAWVVADSYQRVAKVPGGDVREVRVS